MTDLDEAERYLNERTPLHTLAIRALIQHLRSLSPPQPKQAPEGGTERKERDETIRTDSTTPGSASHTETASRGEAASVEKDEGIPNTRDGGDAARESSTRRGRETAGAMPEVLPAGTRWRCTGGVNIRQGVFVNGARRDGDGYRGYSTYLDCERNVISSAHEKRIAEKWIDWTHYLSTVATAPPPDAPQGRPGDDLDIDELRRVYAREQSRVENRNSLGPPYSRTNAHESALTAVADYVIRCCNKQHGEDIAEFVRNVGKEPAPPSPSAMGLSDARPLDEWHEDHGAVLWWTFPVRESPYVGSPLWNSWPGRHTHWTPIVVPVEPTQMVREIAVEHRPERAYVRGSGETP